MNERGGDHILAQRLREARLRLNLTQTELAQAGGVSQRNVSDLETERRGRRVDPAIIRRLADVLGVTVGYLLGDVAPGSVTPPAALNVFADSDAPLDVTTTEEFQLLRQRADDLAVPYAEPVACLSRNAVLQQLRLHFVEWGSSEAPPMLLLHGRLRSAHVWDPTALALQDRYHLLALDQRGHGDSEWTRNEDYSLEAFVQDALAFCNARALDRPVLVGHGLGALVALGMAVEDPALPCAIVIVDMAPEVTSTTISRVREYTLANAVFEDVETFVEREHHRSPYRSRAEIAETACYELLQRNDGKYINKADPALQEQLVADRETPMFQLFAFDDTKAPACPVLIVRGEFSNVIPADAASRFAGRFANAQLVTLPAAAHEPHTQNVPEFVRVLSSFLESL